MELINELISCFFLCIICKVYEVWLAVGVCVPEATEG